MKITVCQLSEDQFNLEQDWARLVAHVTDNRSQLVLLPEMPFYDWFPRETPAVPVVWSAAVSVHRDWLARLPELAPAVVLGTRPVERQGARLNEGFVWDHESGYHLAHHKYYLPDEQGFWEATWYQRGDGDFSPIEVNAIQLGFLICTEMWFTQHARNYGKSGIHLLVVPRATPHETLGKWLAGGRTAAVISGAYCLSSNACTPGAPPLGLGGQGWIIDPNGEVLGLTSPEKPFLTVEIDLALAERAKNTYPRYVQEQYRPGWW